MDISFIISEFHNPEEIAPCLDALRKHAVGLSYEFIVTSNSEYAGEIRDKLRRDFPGIRWVFNEKNKGYAFAMNRGLEQAAGEAVVLLNPDVRLKSAIGPAFRFLTEHSGIALLGPRIVDGQGGLQDGARPFLTPWRALKRSLARISGKGRAVLESHFDYGRAQPVDWVIGAFMMVKKAAIAKVGMLDERYFMYVEDMDWCRRFRDNGFEVFYFPGTTVEYRGTRQSTAFLAGGTAAGRLTLVHARSYLRFLLKHRLFFAPRGGRRG